jgi:hypothetical protein
VFVINLCDGRLKVSANGALRRFCAGKVKEVAGGWRKVCDEKVCNFYTSPDTNNWEYEMRGFCSLGEVRSEHNIFVGKCERDRPLEG